MVFFAHTPGSNLSTQVEEAVPFTTSYNWQSSSTTPPSGDISSRRRTEQDTSGTSTAATYANILTRPPPQPNQERNVIDFKHPTEALIPLPPQSATTDTTAQKPCSHDAETAGKPPLSSPTSDSVTAQQRGLEDISLARLPLSVRTSFGDVENPVAARKPDLQHTSVIPQLESAASQKLATPVSSERSYSSWFSSESSAPAQQITPSPPPITPQHQEWPQYIQIERRSSQVTANSYFAYKLSRVHAGLIAWIHMSSSIAFRNHPCFIWGADSSGMVEVSKVTTRHGESIENLDRIFTKRCALKRRKRDNILIDDGETQTYYNPRVLHLEAGTLQKRSYVDLSCTERIHVSDLCFLDEMPRVRAEDVELAIRHYKRMFPERLRERWAPEGAWLPCYSTKIPCH